MFSNYKFVFREPRLPDHAPQCPGRETFLIGDNRDPVLLALNKPDKLLMASSLAGQDKTMSFKDPFDIFAGERHYEAE